MFQKLRISHQVQASGDLVHWGDLGGVTAGSVEAVLRREGGTLLEQLEVLDEYRGAGLPPGTRGVTWRCTFRDPAKTLTEREIDALLSRMLKALEAEFDVHRRQA